MTVCAAILDATTRFEIAIASAACSFDDALKKSSCPDRSRLRFVCYYNKRHVTERHVRCSSAEP